MQQDDRAAIDGLFRKIAEVERQAPARDAEAEAHIAEHVGRQPAAPYFMAQTIVVQEHALNDAQARIEALEAELAARPKSGGGLFSGLFGDDAGARRPGRGVPQVARNRSGAVPPPGQAGAQAGAQAGGRPGGFLAGAAQTAMGVAGGVLIANAIGGMLSGGAAEAGEAGGVDDGEAGLDDGGDFGGDDFDMDF